MYNTINITDAITWIGASDRTLSRFENLFDIPEGMAYNSYVIKDEKTAILDTADSTVTDQYFTNLQHVIGDTKVDYLVVHHMEPDHCVNIKNLCFLYPDMKIVASAKAADMMNQFFGEEIKDKVVIVKENDVLDLGKHKLTFMTAPMVHWPEVLYSYESTSKILFCADAFGSFGALNGNIFSKHLEYDSHRISEYRRYYSNICGRFGMQVGNSLKKALKFDIKMLCPLHGPIVNEEQIPLLIDKYTKWSSYTPETKSVMIVYGSMYGNTAGAANMLANKLAKEGVTDISIFDVSATEISYLVSEAFRVSHIVIASPTYNVSIYRPIKEFIEDLQHLNIKNRSFSIIENGFWTWGAAAKIKDIVDTYKDCKVVGEPVRINSAVDEKCEEELLNLAKLIKADMDN